MNPRVFVLMPSGIKEGIDFDSVYTTFIEPALVRDGDAVLRAGSASQSAGISMDVFQELLLADAVIADVTLDDPHVWYALGIRDALRADGAILLSARAHPMPFDTDAGRSLTYSLHGGAPDIACLTREQTALLTMVRTICNAPHGRKTSPVYKRLPFLAQPDWTSLKVEPATAMGEHREHWQSLVRNAQNNGYPGDMLVLAEEAPSRELALEAYRTAAESLRRLGSFSFALEQINNARAIAPDDVGVAQDRGVLLGELRRFSEAREWLQRIAGGHPDDAGIWSLLGRVETDIWIDHWRNTDGRPAEKIRLAAGHLNLLNAAAHTYATGFGRDPGHYGCGINAVMLSHLARHLGGDEDPGQRTKRQAMEGGVRWAAEAALARGTMDTMDFQARIALAELDLLLGDEGEVRTAFRDAVGAARKDWFALDSSLQRLRMLRELEFHPARTDIAISEIASALDNLARPWHPRTVCLFSGHMIDAPGRDAERFVPAMAPDVVAAIEANLGGWDAGEGDLAICQGACGGDLLFARAALARGMTLWLYLPFEEPIFLAQSVAFAGEEWRHLYLDVRQHARTLVRIMPEELGKCPDRVDPYERANRWLLHSALAWGPGKVCFLTLWDGEKSGKPGGTDHMISAVRERLGRIHVIDAVALLESARAGRAGTR